MSELENIPDPKWNQLRTDLLKMTVEQVAILMLFENKKAVDTDAIDAVEMRDSTHVKDVYAVTTRLTVKSLLKSAEKTLKTSGWTSYRVTAEGKLMITLIKKYGYCVAYVKK